MPPDSARARVLLVISGGIAAYKSLELIRLLRTQGIAVTPVLTQAARAFVTPLSVQTLAGEAVREDLFSLTDESAIGHIELSRAADLVVVCPASAHLIARMRAGLADDLATTLLLATDTPVLVAPAMNVRMWEHPATQENLAVLRRRGISFVGPAEGDMACGEFGPGRLAEPAEISSAVAAHLFADQPLAGMHALVTAGPTHEPIDPVRVIANRSSGRQGYAIASALARKGARVTLVSGPVSLPPPPDVTVIKVETACEMLEACRAALPADIAVCVAAVADWRVDGAGGMKLKKSADGPPTLRLVENPDILASLAAPGPQRPRLVIGFAAETHDVLANATAKRRRKGTDWLLANSVGDGASVFGSEGNEVTLITDDGSEPWAAASKTDIAAQLVERIVAHFGKPAS